MTGQGVSLQHSAHSPVQDNKEVKECVELNERLKLVIVITVHLRRHRQRARLPSRRHRLHSARPQRRQELPTPRRH